MVNYSIVLSLVIVTALGFGYMPVWWSLGRQIFTTAMTASMATMTNRTVTPYSMAFVTVPDEKVAKTISQGIVKGKLAACVNIIPKVTSVYEWEGAINEDSELLLMIKTRTSRIDDLTNYVKENHPYKVCEVIATSIEKGNQPYLDWIGSVVPEKSAE